MQEISWKLFQMSKKKKLFFFLVSLLLVNCSFDNKTGIWDGKEKEKIKVSDLKKIQKEEESIEIENAYSSETTFSKEVKLNKIIEISNQIKNSSWLMSGLNYQNSLGNIFLPGSENLFMKEKVGKNKFSLSKIKISPLVHNNNIFFSDNKGSIFNINQAGDIIWKINIYKKVYKKIFKKLSIAIYNNNIYVTDNLGLIYSISINTGKVIWIKNHGIPFKSKIKVYENKIFAVNQDNRILCFSIKDGLTIWNIRTISSFIKSQNLLSLAISKQGDLIASNSSGDLIKINTSSGEVYWSLNTLSSVLKSETDFFSSSDIVISNNKILFSTKESFFSYNLNNGYADWKTNISSIGTPIIYKNNIFFVTKNGFFVILDFMTGKVLSSTDILKVLKKRHQSTKITGYIMGSGKIYAVTINGYLIVSSASTGKVESFKKIGDPITSPPVISNGKLFLYTDNSKILVFN